MKTKRWLACLAAATSFVSLACHAEYFGIATTISRVHVATADTVNPGVTCIQVSSTIPPACNGYIAIPNNSKLLVAAALQTRASGGTGYLIYADTGGPFHCSNIVLTPCSVISIDVR